MFLTLLGNRNSFLSVATMTIATCSISTQRHTAQNPNNDIHSKAILMPSNMARYFLRGKKSVRPILEQHRALYRPHLYVCSSAIVVENSSDYVLSIRIFSPFIAMYMVFLYHLRFVSLIPFRTVIRLFNLYSKDDFAPLLADSFNI